MKRQVQPISAFEGQGRLGQRDASGISMGVEIFVPLLAERLIPPGLIIARHMKRGPVCAHRDFATDWYCRVSVAESDPLVEQPERDVNATTIGCIALQSDRHLGMVVADRSLFAPRLLPVRVGRPAIDARDGAVMRLGLTDEIKTQSRRRQDRLSQATYRERGVAVLHGNA